MISVLRIRNLALAESSTVEFGPGLNVITGETGAGKSILIGALGLLLGNRADKSLIRSGEEACAAEAVFQLKDYDALNEILVECGVDECVDGELVIRRIVRAEGGNQNWVNGCAVALQVLKRIGNLLVDIHGPHDHQSLLQPDTQLEILDAFGHLWKERGLYEEIYERLRDLERQEAALSGDDAELAEQIDRLAYRVKEIGDAAIREDEEEELLQEHTVLGSAQRIQELGGMAVAGLSESDDGSAYDILTQCRQQVNALQGLLPDAEAWLEELDAAILQIQELSTDMSGVLSEITHNQERLEWLDERLALYQKLKRKYGPEPADVLRVYRDSEEKLHALETRGEQLAELGREKEKCQADLKKAADALSKRRKDAAAELVGAVQGQLQALGLKNSSFSVAFEPSEARPSGMDVIDYEFAPNKGEEKRPLRLIASSGEMSRVMLATKAVLAAHDRIPVLVFDEIDSNVGGEIAGAVGAKLRDVAQKHQVLCITHFPQVAVYGRSHLAVEKFETEGRTFSRVRLLDEAERVEELARMLGGRDLTSITLDHAREMLESAQIDE